MDPKPQGATAVSYQPLATYVTQQLRDAILDERLKPGAPVRQEAVAREFGTSRIPVREALCQLENEGLVTIEPGSTSTAASTSAATKGRRRASPG